MRYKYEEPTGEHDRCICAFDRSTHDAWPCHMKDTWVATTCTSCNSHAYCMRDTAASSMEFSAAAAAAAVAEKESTTKAPSLTGLLLKQSSSCICAPSNFCVAYNGKAPILEIWRYLRGGPTTEDPSFLEALGFGVGNLLFL